jgi:type II secretory pathway pseudopilin PulG
LAFLAFMAVAVLLALNPVVQLGKARDARRKSDLSKLKNILEDYYNDKKCYPSSLNDLVPDYLGQLPTDPLTHQNYAYYPTGCDKYRIYVKLDYEKDPAIAEVGCQDGCGPGGGSAGGCAYNYGVCSSNVKLEKCGEEECMGTWWACQGKNCNDYGSARPTCTGPGNAYCNDSTCGGGCTPAKCCTDCGGI